MAIPHKLTALLDAYHAAPSEFHATSYWTPYNSEIVKTIADLDIREIQSGKYPILATMGFGDFIYYYHPHSPFWQNAALKLIQGYLIKNRRILPYDLRISDIGEMAYRYCELLGQLTGAKPISELEMATIGNPADVFEIKGRKYSVHFLSYYVRYCFVHQQVGLTGNEIIVELGSGSGKQVEVLKKLYPGMTILCFDLPAQIYLCETYLTAVFGKDAVVGTDETLGWTDLSQVQKGRIHFLGNWQLPMARTIAFDGFWNAASFGEMEPEVVERYLSYIKGHARWVYLLQARQGKELNARNRVEKKTTFEDYDRFLSGYKLAHAQDAYEAHRRMSPSGGYFEAVWKREDRP